MPSEIVLENEHFYQALKLFHFNCIEKDLYIAIRVRLLNLNIAAW